MTREERLELNELSKEVYGTYSRWYKLWRKGQSVRTSESTPNKSTGKTVKHSEWKYATLEELKTRMLDLKAQKQKLLDEAKKKVDDSK